MKMKTLAQKKITMVTPTGNMATITFLDFVRHCYLNSKFKGKISEEKYMWANIKALNQTWEIMEKETIKRVEANQKWYNKARIALKYFFLGQYYRLKARIKALVK